MYTKTNCQTGLEAALKCAADKRIEMQCTTASISYHFVKSAAGMSIKRRQDSIGGLLAALHAYHHSNALSSFTHAASI